MVTHLQSSCPLILAWDRVRLEILDIHGIVDGNNQLLRKIRSYLDRGRSHFHHYTYLFIAVLISYHVRSAEAFKPESNEVFSTS